MPISPISVSISQAYLIKKLIFMLCRSARFFHVFLCLAAQRKGMVINMINKNLREKIFEHIRSNIPLIYEDVEISDNMNLVNDLGYESISLIKLITDIESDFNIIFDYDIDLESVLIITNLIKYVETKITAVEVKNDET